MTSIITFDLSDKAISVGTTSIKKNYQPTFDQCPLNYLESMFLNSVRARIYSSI